MNFPAKEVRLNDGRTVLLRPPCERDAAGTLEFLRAAGEPAKGLPTEAELAESLHRLLDDPRAALMVAEARDSLAGVGILRPVDVERCGVGVALRGEYRSAGLARELLERLLTLASVCRYARAVAEAPADDAEALAFYREAGFEARNGQPQGASPDVILLSRQV